MSNEKPSTFLGSIAAILFLLYFGLYPHANADVAQGLPIFLAAGIACFVGAIVAAVFESRRKAAESDNSNRAPDQDRPVRAAEVEKSDD